MKKINAIHIDFVNADQQRYDTIGDYYIKNKTLYIKITKFRNKLIEFSILVHEIIEALLVVARGISIDKIDEFDMSFTGKGEPGDEKDCPYKKEHKFATKIETMMDKELGI